ncbi:MAG: glycosyltransferase family 2 protein [Actinomycetota bacterium]|nr:glycosyltransferase family 2 protein [Actinomycetota bacterium]
MLDEAIQTLDAQRFADLRVLVVDNGSEDGSIQHLAERWPSVGVVALDRNLGFAAAINRGVRASAGEFVATINNDVRLDPDWTGRLVAALEETPNAASATGKILRALDPGVLDGAGDLVGWDGYCARRGADDRDTGQYDRREPVFSACAGAALYRRSALNAVGPFDESFFLYIEDADWGFRAQLAGYDCVYEPQALAFHLGGASSGRTPGLELYYAHRNMITLMVKNFPVAALLRHLPFAVGRRAGSLIKAAGGGQARIILRAWGAAVLRLPRSLRARAQIQRRRVRGRRELDQLVPDRAPRRQGRAP